MSCVSTRTTRSYSEHHRFVTLRDDSQCHRLVINLTRAAGSSLTPWATSTRRRLILRPEILDQPQQHARAGVGIGGLDMLGRIMADAAAAAHEQHGDVSDVDHRHAVMPCPARQFEHAISFRGNGFRHLRFQPWRAGHGAVFVGDVDLQRQARAASRSLRSAARYRRPQACGAYPSARECRG